MPNLWLGGDEDGARRRLTRWIRNKSMDKIASFRRPGQIGLDWMLPLVFGRGSLPSRAFGSHL